MEAGPIPASHEVIRWRLIDLAQWIWDKFGLSITKQTLSREMRALGFRKLSARLHGRPDRPSTSPRLRTIHGAYTYGSVGDLLDTYVRLKNAGIEPYWPVHHGTTMSLYYIDPDGNRMEFQVDVGTVEEATALMRAPAYAENPVGVLYDPDALLARFEAGETEQALLVQPVGPPSPIPAAHGIT